MMGPDARTPSARSAETRAVVDRVARESWGRLIAHLSVASGDIAGAEDGLSQAIAEALQQWPSSGIPASPEGWLLTVARRRVIDALRRARRFEPAGLLAMASSPSAYSESAWIGDDRLRLMFVCTHPAIDLAVRPALMLQTVLGLDTEAIASAFVISPEAMTKRLVRAKTRIREAGIRFEVPEPDDLGHRVHSVLEAIYATFFLGQDAPTQEPTTLSDLSTNAISLARVVTEMLPACAESFGLLAMMLFCEARRRASTDLVGRFVPLPLQDPALWHASTMDEAYRLLARAWALGQPGPFQIEAAIHGAHCSRYRSGLTPWPEIANLYDRLVERWPTLGACVGRALAQAYACQRPQIGIDLLDQAAGPEAENYQPWWATRAHLLGKMGRLNEAVIAYGRAISLTSRSAVRDFLLRERAALHDVLNVDQQ